MNNARPRRLWLGLMLAVAVSVPFAFAAVARTFVPPPPAEQRIGTLPVGGRPRDLSTEMEHVPLLIDDLPDAESRAAVNAYRHADIFSADQVGKAFADAWGALALHAPTESSIEIYELGRALVEPASGLPDGVDAVFEALVSDPDNGARLTNAAVMLFGYAALIDSGIASRPDDTDYGYSWGLEANAIVLLDEVARHFGSSREIALNRGLFESVTGGAGGMRTAEDLVAEVVEADPHDVTARWMLSNLQARRFDDGRGYEDAVATLQPLLSDPGTRLLGEAATGDAYLAAASLRATEAPRTSAFLARRAVDHFDRVLGEVADAGAYAGRARALALLGDSDGAVLAMEKGVEVAPLAVDLALGLAALQQAAGDLEAMHKTALGVLPRTSEGWAPRLADARFVAVGVHAHPGDLGMLGASVGSARDHVAIIRFFEGGGFLADVEVVPRIIDPELDASRRGDFAPDVAARLAIDASWRAANPLTPPQRTTPGGIWTT